jgi:hypothetical protein
LYTPSSSGAITARAGYAEKELYSALLLLLLHYSSMLRCESSFSIYCLSAIHRGIVPSAGLFPEKRHTKCMTTTTTTKLNLSLR